MKVLNILNELNYSGAEVMLKTARPYFDKASLKIFILSTGEFIGDYASKFEDVGYIVDHIKFKKNFYFFLSLIKYIRQNKFDVVHIHTERASFWYAFIAFFCGVRKIIRTVHSIFAYTGILRIRRIIQRSLMRNIFKVKFTTISRSVFENEKKTLFNKSVVISNWIDNEKYYPVIDVNEKIDARNKLKIPIDAIVLVSVGSCQQSKNHYAIIEALDYLNESSNNYFYVHVGAGSLEESEKKYAIERHVQNMVLFTGQSDNVRNIIIACDILVMSSLYEGLGNVILEALATGIPVVAYNVEGINSVIKDEYNGLLCAPNSISLAQKVLYLLNNKKLCEKIINNGLSTLSNEYSTETLINKLISLYSN